MVAVFELNTKQLITLLITSRVIDRKPTTSSLQFYGPPSHSAASVVRLLLSRGYLTERPNTTPFGDWSLGISVKGKELADNCNVANLFFDWYTDNKAWTAAYAKYNIAADLILNMTPMELCPLLVHGDYIIRDWANTSFKRAMKQRNSRKLVDVGSIIRSLRHDV